MRYLSVCSGIEAASVAWHHLGWEPVGFSEIEPFPAAVLAHRFPNVPNYGDMTKFEEWPIERGTIDVLVGGTPCQSFSVAGLRQGLADPRGNLMLTYLAIADRLRPRWLVWENVPGVLSSGGGRDFGTFLGALGQLGYGWAYRVLDAQYVRVGGWPRAVPQRRRRVFVVGCLGNWAAAGEVLALSEGLQRNLEARRAKRKGVAADSQGGVARCITTGEMKRQDYETWMNHPVIAQPTAGTLGTRGLRSHTELDGHGAYIPVAPVPIQDGREMQKAQNGIGIGTHGDPAYTLDTTGAQAVGQPVPYDLFQITAPVNRQNRAPGDPCHTLAKDNAAHAAVAFTVGNAARGQGPSPSSEVFPTLKSGEGRGLDDQWPSVMTNMTVRRLTPRECERLQGFPDDWTMIPYRGKPPEECPDGPRYKALGNSMACNCMSWIGERIAAYESQTPNQKEHT
jgi:DNA (cytosine-5)-methyltransferase 1